MPGMPPVTGGALGLSQWFTPPDLAQRIVDWCGDIDGKRVLEPSSGGGAISNALVGGGATVVSIEIDPTLADPTLNPNSAHAICGDFLAQGPGELGKFNLCVMNPPYENNMDLKFVLHAFRFAPRVIALLRLDFLAGSLRRKELWASHGLRRLAILSTRPRFVGPQQGTPMSDFAVYDFVPNPCAHTQIEWWP